MRFQGAIAFRVLATSLCGGAVLPASATGAANRPVIHDKQTKTLEASVKATGGLAR